MLGDFFSKMSNGLRSAGGFTLNGLKNVFRSAKQSGFGFKKPVKAVSNATGKVANYLHVSKRAVAGTMIFALALGGTSVGLTVASRIRQDAIMRQDYVKESCVADVDKVKDIALNKMGEDDARKLDVASKVWGLCKYLGWTDQCAAALLGCMECESDIDPAKIEGGFTNYGDGQGIWTRINQTWPDGICDYTTEWLLADDMSSNNIYGRPSPYRNWNVPTWTNNNGTGKHCTLRGHSGSGFDIQSDIYGNAPDGHFYCGIGLIQGTGNRGYSLYKYAESGGRNWWDLAVQLAFLIDETGGDGKDRVSFMWCKKDYNYRSWSRIPGCNGKTAHDVTDQGLALRMVGLDLIGGNYDPSGSAHDSGQYAPRIKAAEYWYGKFAGTQGDQAFARSVVALAGQLDKEAVSGAVKSEEEECDEDETPTFDNSDIARAAVSYAFEWKHKEAGYHSADQTGCRGTDLYQFVHDHVHDGEKKSYYVGCDIGVTTAVRWSDADTNFPHAGPGSIIRYCISHKDKWDHLGEYGVNVKFDDLQPGDVFSVDKGGSGKYARRGQFANCGAGHVALYTGNEIIMEKFGEDKKSYYWVAASIHNYAPAIQSSHYPGGTATDMGYQVFRLKEGAGFTEVKYRHCTDGAPELTPLSGYINTHKQTCAGCSKAKAKADRGDYDKYLK